MKAINHSHLAEHLVNHLRTASTDPAGFDATRTFFYHSCKTKGYKGSDSDLKDPMDVAITFAMVCRKHVPCQEYLMSIGILNALFIAEKDGAALGLNYIGGFLPTAFCSMDELGKLASPGEMKCGKDIPEGR